MNHSSVSPIRRAQLLVMIATLVGFCLRIWPIGRLGLNQFDEGIYWISAQWVYRPAGIWSLDPILIAYAPPGYSILIGLLASLTGLSEQTGILVSAIFGSLTIPIVARFGRQIFGLEAGVITAWCVCFAGPHIAFSRTGLTDATFLWVWSIGCLTCLIFLRTPNLGRGLVMGLLVGLTQQTKYYGWLLGAFVVLTWVAGPGWSRSERRPERWLKTGACGLVGAFVAALVVWPWFRFVENHGGYDALLRHQRSYLGGYSVWWSHLRSQAQQASELSGPTWLPFVNILAILWSLAWLRSTGERSIREIILRSIVIAIVVWPLLAAPATTGILFLLTLKRNSAAEIRFLAISWITLFLLSPFYHPYARLWLPLEQLHWVILGGLVIQLSHQLDGFRGHKLWPLHNHPGWFAGYSAIFISFLIFGPGAPLAGRNSFHHSGLFDPSDSLRLLTGPIADRLTPDVPYLRTLVRPALSNSLSGLIRILPQRDLAQFRLVGNSNSWALVDSTLLTGELTSQTSQKLRFLLTPLLEDWEIVGEFPTATTLPTALDLDPNRRQYSRSTSMACVWLLKPRSRTLLP